jgi:hypothetical protein
MPFLIGLTGPYTGQAFEVKDGRTTIGRGPACDLLLSQDAAVSRAHAVLVSAGGVVQVQEAGSTHGIWVNGKRTGQAILRSGDCLQVGASVFQLQPVPAQIGEPTRLKVVLPRPSTPAGVPGVGVFQEPPLPLPMGCLYYLVALLFPIPFGFMIAAVYRKKTHPANRQFGTTCLIVSLLSLVLQVALSILLAQQVLRLMGPTLGPLGGFDF